MSGPQALVEAMAAGAAPVVSDLPCVREWVDPGWNGVLVNPKDTDAVARAIIELLQDAPKRDLFAGRNREIVREGADEDKEMAKMEQLYFSLLKNSV